MTGRENADEGGQSRVTVDRILAGRLVLTCRLAVGIRLLLVAGILAIPIAFVSARLWDWVYLSVLGTFVVSMAGYIVLAASLRCPGCARRFLVESLKPPHPAARREGHMGVWGTMVWSVTRRREFTCIHCGKSWRLQ